MPYQGGRYLPPIGKKMHLNFLISFKNKVNKTFHYHENAGNELMIRMATYIITNGKIIVGCCPSVAKVQMKPYTTVLTLKSIYGIILSKTLSKILERSLRNCLMTPDFLICSNSNTVHISKGFHQSASEPSQVVQTQIH